MARPRSTDKKRIRRFRTNSNRAFGRFLAAQIDSDGNNHNLVDPNASLDSQTSDPASLRHQNLAVDLAQIDHLLNRRYANGNGLDSGTKSHLLKRKEEIKQALKSLTKA